MFGCLASLLSQATASQIGLLASLHRNVRFHRLQLARLAQAQGALTTCLASPPVRLPPPSCSPTAPAKLNSSPSPPDSSSRACGNGGTRPRARLERGPQSWWQSSPASGGRQRASNPVASSLPSAAAEIDPRN